MAGADVEESAGKSGDAGTGGTLECGDCSLLAETCVVGVCDTELGRCSRQPVVACRSGDGCCPAGCAQDDDDDCTARRIVLAPLYSGNRREDGALGATTFAGIKDEQRFYAFFTFDLSGIEGTVASAELSLHYQAYLSPDPEEHFVVLGVTTGVEALIDPALRADVFDELQAGSQYFDTSMTLEHQGSVVPFPLDGMALGDLNARLGSTTSFGIVADGTLGNSSAVEGIRFSDGVEAPLERLSLIVEP